MVRSLWKRTLVVSLAWAGLAWAQQPNMTPNRPAAKAAPAASTERVLTVQELGKPSQKCKILKTWQTSEGSSAYQVQSLATGEIMTIVESGPATTVPGSQPGTRVQAMATRIFHWGRDEAPPAGTPMPPVEIVQTMPAPRIGQETVIMQTPRAGRETVIIDGSGPVTERAERPNLLSRLTHKGSTESVTIVEPTAEKPGLFARLFHRDAASTVTTTTSSTIVKDSGPTTTPSKEANDRLVKVATSANESQAKVKANDKKDEKQPASDLTQKDSSSSTTKASTAPAPASDWRKSWGKADDHKSPATAKAQPTTPENQTAATLPQADIKRPDPLQMPERYNRRTVEEKPVATKQDVENLDMVAKAPVASSSATTMPAGIGSVISANESAPGSVRYIPVPIITVPDLRRPPMPPTPQIPRPPQVVPQQNGMNNTWSAAPANKALGPTNTTTDEGLTNAFTTMPSQDAVARATNAFSSPDAGSVAAVGAYAARPMAQGPATAGMYAPTQPQAVAAAGMRQDLTAVGYQAAAQGREQMLAAQNLQQMLAVLKDSLYPSQREWAAESLCAYDWHTQPHVVQALTTAAKDDPAATVRAACVRCLGKMNVNTMPVVSTMQSLRSDRDPRVRQEVEQTLATLSQTAGVKQTSAR